MRIKGIRRNLIRNKNLFQGIAEKEKQTLRKEMLHKFWLSIANYKKMISKKMLKYKICIEDSKNLG